MKKTVAATIVIVVLGMVLAACSGGKPQLTLAQSIAQTNRQDNISPTPYTGAPTTFLGYTVVDGVDPHMFSPLAIKDLAKEKQFVDSPGWELMSAPNVFTITAGRQKGSIIMKACMQGVINTATHTFDAEPTLGPAIPAGTPIEVPIKKNGKIVMFDGHAAVQPEPAPPGDHQPGPFYAFGEVMHFNGKQWVNASPLGYINGNWSCTDA